MDNQKYWIAYRNGVISGVFPNRRMAVFWLKTMLKQTLKDFDKQDKTDEYDYPIDIKSLEIKPVKTREAYLGL